jgi:hypothetical protein
MEKYWLAIKEFLKLNAMDRLIVTLMVVIVALYLWNRSVAGDLASARLEINVLHQQKFQLQQDKEIQIVRCEQEKFNIQKVAKIECEKEKQEIHKSYAESAKQFKKTFNQNR